MNPWYDDGTVTVYHGDNADILPLLADESVDAVVTDPPYELRFMGRSWDASGVAYSVEFWRECLRVLKPGGHLLAFGGTRTWHRLVCAIEDAGFEIRDSIGYGSSLLAWCYGSGFPKSQNLRRSEDVCRCVPTVRRSSAENAPESTTDLLFAGVFVGGQASSSYDKDLPSLRDALHPDDEVPGGQEQGLRAPVCGGTHLTEQEGEAVTTRSASNGELCDLRHTDQAASQHGAEERQDLLLVQVQREGTRSRPSSQSIRRDGDQEDPALRCGQPGMEGRSDVQAAEGELRRPSVCPMPSGVEGDGQGRRLHHGASSGDGQVGRAATASYGGGEPHRPQSTEQQEGQPGVVSVERGSQAWRGWPFCSRCGKPIVPSGLGTALKPAWEPIVVARKHLVGTVAENVLAFGTGALNIDACRTDTNSAGPGTTPASSMEGRRFSMAGAMDRVAYDGSAGRWPTNIVFSHSAGCVEGGECAEDCPVDELDRQAGPLKSGANPTRRRSDKFRDAYGDFKGQTKCVPARGADEGGASRFFPIFRYEAKAPSSERPRVDGVAHETVKPLDLMKFMVRLVTRPGGTVLDPFLGSGTTAEACVIEGFQCVGIERDERYLPLIKARLSKPLQPVLDFESEPARGPRTRDATEGRVPSPSGPGTATPERGGAR